MLETGSSKNKLRIGIMCNGLNFPAWAARSIEETCALDFVEPVLLIQDSNSPTRQKNIFFKLFQYPYSKLLYRFYDRLLLRPSAFANTNLKDLLSNLSVVTCRTTLKGKYSQYFSQEDIQTIREHKLDIILRFGFNIIRGEILDVAKYGVWSYHHCDPQKYRGGPLGFWEIMNDDPVTGAILQRLTDKLDGGIVLKRGYFKTIDKSLSDNMDHVLWNSVSWVKQVCIDINNGNSAYINDQPIETDAPIFKYPNNITFIEYFFRKCRNTLRFHRNELFRPEQWNVGIVKRSALDIMKQGLTNEEVEWLPCLERMEYRADPFLMNTPNGMVILCERYSYRKKSAIIEEVPLDDIEKGKNAISEKHHLSYPFVFTYKDNHYCIPEAFESGSLSLYHLDKESGEWKMEKTLLENFSGLDPTLVEHNGKWWLFCTNNDPMSNTSLYLFYAETPLGPFKSHSNNPVKTDIRSSRPAGPIFKDNSDLIRPAQDCSSTYGSRVAFNRIVEITPETFKEEVVGYLNPVKNSLFSEGLHTISGLGDMTVIDSKRYIANRQNFNTSVLRKIKKLFFHKTI